MRAHSASRREPVVRENATADVGIVEDEGLTVWVDEGRVAQNQRTGDLHTVRTHPTCGGEPLVRDEITVDYRAVEIEGDPSRVGEGRTP